MRPLPLSVMTSINKPISSLLAWVPFTAMGTFNRSMTDANRKSIAGELVKFLGVNRP